MARPRTKGSVEWVGDDATGHWRARVSVGPKQRRWIDLPSSIGRDREAKARTEAKKIADLASGGKLVLPERRRPPRRRRASCSPTGVCVGSSRASSAVSRALAPTARSSRRGCSRVLCARPVAEIARTDVEDGRVDRPSGFPAREAGVEDRAERLEFLSKALGDASNGKVQALRVRADDPSAEVAPPERGVEKAKQWLYPSEFLKLVACPAIDLDVRRAYAITVYLYPRAGEVEALHWDDLVLEQGTVHVHRAADPDSDVIRATKGKAARRFEIEAETLPTARDGEARPKDERVFDPWPLHRHRAEQLRDNLKLAGVTVRSCSTTPPRQRTSPSTTCEPQVRPGRQYAATTH